MDLAIRILDGLHFFPCCVKDGLLRMLFSIVVPVYNVSEYLDDCLGSIDAQSFHDYEVILVDDGSIDCSGAICDTYVHDNPERVCCIHQQNAGLLAARRAGFRAAHGMYIVSLDGDDCLKPDTLESLKRAIECAGSPDVVLYGISRSLNYDTTFNPLPWDENVAFCDEDRAEVLSQLCSSYSLNSMCSKAIRRDKAALEYDFSRFGRLNFGEDLLQVMPVLDVADTILYLKENLYYYRVNPNSISKSYSRSQFDDISVVRTQLLSFAREWDAQLPGNDFQSKVRGLSIQAAAECMQRACQSLSKGEWKQEVERIAASSFFVESMNDEKARFVPRADYLLLAKLARANRFRLVRFVSLIKKFLR